MADGEHESEFLRGFRQRPRAYLAICAGLLGTLAFSLMVGSWAARGQSWLAYTSLIAPGLIFLLLVWIARRAGFVRKPQRDARYWRRARRSAATSAVLFLFYAGLCGYGTWKMFSLFWDSLGPPQSPPVTTFTEKLRVRAESADPETRRLVLMTVGGFAAFAFAMAAVALAQIWAWKRATRMLRREEGKCERCGYSLQGLPEPRCPECGTPFLAAPPLASRR